MIPTPSLSPSASISTMISTMISIISCNCSNCREGKQADNTN